MGMNPASLGLSFDLTWSGTIQQSQRWVLVSMQQYGPALVTMLWRILGNEEDVCDAYQDTFLRLVHLPEKKRPSNIRGYLFQSASNVAISMLRRKKLQKTHQRDVFENHRPNQRDPVRELDSKSMQQVLREAIADLPDYLADVVMLRDLAEMPYSKVAQILNISASAARVYRHKAIKLLASRMSKLDSQETS